MRDGTDLVGFNLNQKVKNSTIRTRATSIQEWEKEEVVARSRSE